MPTNGIIAKKLALLDDNLVKVEKLFANVTLEQFATDWALQKIAERVLQIMVEIVIDIAERLIALHQAGPAVSSADAIEKLVDLKILRSCQPYVEMIKFRNFIVHQYASVAPEILYDIIANRLDSFRAFRDEVMAA